MITEFRRSSLVLLILGIGLVIAGVVGGISTARGSDIPPPPRTHWMATPCASDDIGSTNCFWNAKKQGNRTGHSFYVVTRHLEGTGGKRIGRVTCVYYVKRADARKWDACHLLPGHHKSRDTLAAVMPNWADIEIGHIFSYDGRDLGSAPCRIYADPNRSYCTLLNPPAAG